MDMDSVPDHIDHMDHKSGSKPHTTPPWDGVIPIICSFS